MRKKCIKCKEKFNYDIDDTHWNEDGSESVKLVRCNACECLQPIRYVEMKNPNNDKRYYFINT